MGVGASRRQAGRAGRPWGPGHPRGGRGGGLGYSGVSSCSSACGGNSAGPGGCSDASLSNAGRRRVRGRWNERRLCTRRAAADRACALGNALRSGPAPCVGPAPGSRADSAAATDSVFSGGAGLAARGRGSRAGNWGCWAVAGDPRRGDECPISGVSEPVSPAGGQGGVSCYWAPVAPGPDSHAFCPMFLSPGLFCS